MHSVVATPLFIRFSLVRFLFIAAIPFGWVDGVTHRTIFLQQSKTMKKEKKKWQKTVERTIESNEQQKKNDATNSCNRIYGKSISTNMSQ